MGESALSLPSPLILRSKYPAISSERERTRYAAVFQDQYGEFLQLQQELGCVQARLRRLEALLAALPPPRSQVSAGDPHHGWLPRPPHTPASASSSSSSAEGGPGRGPRVDGAGQEADGELGAGGKAGAPAPRVRDGEGGPDRHRRPPALTPRRTPASWTSRPAAATSRGN